MATQMQQDAFYPSGGLSKKRDARNGLLDGADGIPPRTDADRDAAYPRHLAPSGQRIEPPVISISHLAMLNLHSLLGDGQIRAERFWQLSHRVKA